MDFLFTLLLMAAYPAIGVHTARSVLRQARTQLSNGQESGRRLHARAWVHAAAMVPLWPAVELIPPLARSSRSGLTRLRRYLKRREQSA
ncbi:hypothetical protein [Amycolatopsis sp. NBC_00438]|uniref:hypothetical protein n=1 Tax=Amycolatopsis sp. NBC_00438 TaxID=2903558 RepID=UPI002E1EC686